MKFVQFLRVSLFFASALFLPLGFAHADQDLTGLWQAYKNFGPKVRGDLVIERKRDTWQADISGHSMEFEVEADGSFTFTLPAELGYFEGEVDGTRLTGHWTQPPPIQVGQRMSSPVQFERTGKRLWTGTVIPKDSEYTLFMPITHEKDGSLSAFIRNPNRNLGVQYNLDTINVIDDRLEFVGSYFYNSDKQVLFEGRYNEGSDYFSAFLSRFRGGSYDFHRVGADDHSDFYARGSRNPGPLIYRAPPRLDDGWSVTTLKDVNIRFAPLRDMIEKEIDTVASNVHDLNVHGVLIARYGKLVFEEYFHGFHRNQPHDTRSASKSMASVLAGAAMQAGLPVQLDTPVYATLEGAKAKSAEKRKRAMTLEHLLTMSSGFYCDDNDSNAPGNENTMQEQEGEPNWYRYTLDLPMAMQPGEEAIYCSANTNLTGAVLTKTTGLSVRDMFARYIAQPLDIKRYYLGLQPTGEVYLGGGAQWLPRDFMKLGQVMLNEGTWNGKRIVSKDWARRSIEAQVNIQDRAYGYQWWIEDYPYKDGTVRAFFAGGNGGQLVVGIPELELLIAFYGGNYSSSASRRSQSVLVPDYILKAVD